MLLSDLVVALSSFNFLHPRQSVFSCSLNMHSFLRSLSVLVTGLTLVRAAPNVTIPAGTLHGTTCSNGASAFFAIPFAVPPVGSLRWTSPKLYEQKFPATGYNATTKSAACIQFGSEFTQSGQTSEDW
jgi:hypothetical protein